MSKKRLLSYVLSLSLLGSTLCGCSGNTEVPTQTATESESTPASETESTQPSEEPSTETQQSEEIVDVTDPGIAHGYKGEATGFTASELVDLMGFGYNIGNSFDAQGGKPNDVSSHETAWGNPVVTKELVDAIADAGFTSVRLPITWYTYVSNDGTYTIKEEYLKRIREVVDYCYDRDLFVIMNLHHEKWLNNEKMVDNQDQIAEEIHAIWTQIAEYFADYDQHLVFEGMNEPRLAGTDMEWGGNESAYQTVNYFAQTFVNAVMDVDKGHNRERGLLIPGYAASNSAAILQSINIPTYNGEAIKNLIISVHCYAPYDFCLSTKMTDFNENNSSCTSPINQTFSIIKSEFLDQGIPVIIGETSATGKEDITARERWASYMSRKASEYGVPIFLWDNGVNGTNGGECHSYINRKTAEIVCPTVLDALFNAKKATLWGSEREKTASSFTSLLEGTQIFSSEEGYESTKQWDAGYITTGAMENYFDGGKDIAVVYKGSGVPKLILTSPQLELWWMCLDATNIETADDKKIAHFKSEKISDMLKENGVSSYSQLGDLSIIAANSNITTFEVVSVGNEHTALYKVNGATYHIGKDIPKAPSLPHYEFLGWYTTRDYQPGTEFDGNVTDNDIVAYAKLSLK